MTADGAPIAPARVREIGAAEASVVAVRADGGATLDGEPAGAEWLTAGSVRRRLRPSDGAPANVLVLPLDPEPGGRRGALRDRRRLEVVVDGWRFELEVESDARASLRERATRAGAAAG